MSKKKTISEILGTHADLQEWSIRDKYNILLEYVEKNGNVKDFKKFVSEKAAIENQEVENMDYVAPSCSDLSEWAGL